MRSILLLMMGVPLPIVIMIALFSRLENGIAAVRKPSTTNRLLFRAGNVRVSGDEVTQRLLG